MKYNLLIEGLSFDEAKRFYAFLIGDASLHGFEGMSFSGFVDPLRMSSPVARAEPLRCPTVTIFPEREVK